MEYTAIVATVRPLAFQRAPTRVQSIADDMNEETRDDRDRYWYDAIPAMTDERFELLMNAYDECLREHQDIQAVFGLL